MENNSYIKKLRLDKADLWRRCSPILIRLDMELTERCNNNCVHCYINLPADDSRAKNDELSCNEIKDILKEAAFLGCLTVRFTGGEPLLREDFEDLYIFARRLGLKVIISTNATLLSPDLVALFSHIPPLEKIEVSLYGMKKISYEGVTRTPGSFEAVWRGIELLLERKIPFIVKGALLPSNKNEIEEFEAWASKIPWMDKPPAYSFFFDLHSRGDRDKNELIKRLRPSPEEGLRFLMRRGDRYLREMKEFCSKFIRLCGDRLFSCSAGCGYGCVDAYGRFQPCILLRHPDYLYDLKNGSLKDALESIFSKIREMKADNPEYLHRCAKCFLKAICEQCPAKSYMEYGNLDTPVEYFCRVAHIQAEHLGLLDEREKGWQIHDWQERIKEFVKK